MYRGVTDFATPEDWFRYAQRMAEAGAQGNLNMGREIAQAIAVGLTMMERTDA